MTHIISVREVSKTYGGTQALRNVSLDVPRGDLVALVGPSGSGKTTLLRVLNLLEMPTSGTFLFDGSDTAVSEADRFSLRRRMGFVFQQTSLFNATVHENVAYPLKVRRETKRVIRKKVTNALALVGLTGFEKRRAPTLSGGEAQRVSLAQSLVYEPEVLLLDEPTANLDPRNAAIIESVISQVNRESGITIIMASHNLLQAEQVAKRVAVFREGELAEIGDVADILRTPSEFVLSFGRMVNVYAGESLMLADGVASVDIGEGVKIEAATQKTGRVTVLVRPEDIIVSRERLTSSARNVLKGRIVEAVDIAHTVALKVHVGKPFTVHVTKRSFQEMGLNLGSEVYLTFKASSVHVL